MARRKKSLSTTLINIATLGFSVLSVTQKISRLFGYETHLAVNSILTLIMLSIATGVLLAATWLGLLAILFVYLLSLNWSITLSLCVMVLVNVFFILLCVLFIHKKKRNIFFPLTRAQIRRLRQQVRALHDEMD